MPKSGVGLRQALQACFGVEILLSMPARRLSYWLIATSQACLSCLAVQTPRRLSQSRAPGGIVATSTTDTTNFWQVLNSSGQPAFGIDTTNLRVGIGTTSPTENLTVTNPNSTATFSLKSAGNSAGNGNIRFDLVNGDANKYDFQFSGNGNTFLKLQYNGATKVFFNTTGQLSLGTATNPASDNMLDVVGSASIGSGYFNHSAPADGLIVQGNVGIGTSSPAIALAVNGQIATNNLPANPGGNTLCYFASTYGILGTCSSDARLKSDITPIASASNAMLTAVLDLKPVTFKWNGDASTTYAGFIAQDVMQSIPLAVRTQPSGYYSLDTTAILAYVVGALQSLSAKLSDLSDTIASFADHFTTRELAFTRATGDDLTVKRLNADETTTGGLCARKVDGTAVCITGDQLAALLSQSAAAGFANPTPAPTQSQLANPTPAAGTSPTDNQLANPTPDTDPASGTSDGTPSTQTNPPVIQINGENPAHTMLATRTTISALRSPARKPTSTSAFIHSSTTHSSPTSSSTPRPRPPTPSTTSPPTRTASPPPPPAP